MKRQRGNQSFTQFKKKSVVRQLEPYLKGGLSIRKACIQSGVSRTTLYKIMKEEPDLANQIKQFQIYIEVLTMGSLTKQLMDIVKKQTNGQELSRIELRFIMWFATNSRHCKDEFGRGGGVIESYDPHIEYMRLANIIGENHEKKFLQTTPQIPS